MASSANDLNKVYLEMQKIASNTQVQLQKMTDTSTAKSFEYNAQEAAKSRNWQTNMSNTAHQREVKDLVKAGLNPVLSANQGAQSYTTSSASASADNPASAVAAMQSSRLSGLANITGSKLGADATKSAAATNAAAMKAAAAQSAAAQKYAADAAMYNARLNYEAQIYKADKDYAASRYRVDNEIPKSVSGLIYKFANRAGIADDIAKDINKLWTRVHGEAAEGLNKVINDFKGSHYSSKNPTEGYSNMNKIANTLSNESLKKLGLDLTAKNRIIFFRAMLCSDKSAQEALYQAIADKKAKQAANAIRNFARYF